MFSTLPGNGRLNSTHTKDYIITIDSSTFELRLSSSLSNVQELAYRSSCRACTGHEDVAALARSWMDNCLQHHTTCPKPNPTGWEPSRLLDISQDKIKLVLKDPAEAHLPYVTLSHCWGTDKFLVLTPDLVPCFMEGVDISSFSLTFQETFITARRLNVRYVWIDCYCIMQGRDDAAQEDWRSESLNMGEIYANSLLNIGALESEGPASGLFRRRPFKTTYSELRWSPDGQERHQKLYLISRGERIERTLEFQQASRSALMKRAWVVQECVMAPRMLSFGRQLFWQCGHLAVCEQFPCEPRPWVRGTGIVNYHTFWLLGGEGRPYQYPHDNGGYVSRWIHTLSIYTTARLSYPQKDLFAALNGVGTELAKRSGSMFRSGILASALQQSLLFHCGRQVKKRDMAMPTWHWSSCYPEMNLIIAQDVVNPNRCRPMAYSFMSDDCRPLPDAFAQDYWPNLIFVGRFLTRQLYNQEDYFDAEGEDGGSPDEEKVYAPLFEQSWGTGLMYCYGLILMRSMPGAYRRLGVWRAQADNGFHPDAFKTRPQLIVLE